MGIDRVSVAEAAKPSLSERDREERQQLTTQQKRRQQQQQHNAR